MGNITIPTQLKQRIGGKWFNTHGKAASRISIMWSWYVAQFLTTEPSQCSILSAGRGKIWAVNKKNGIVENLICN